MLLVAKSLLYLILLDLYLLRGNFAALHRKIRFYQVARTKPKPDTIARVCAAVEAACMWYPKQALCLQRSAVTTCLLRQYGVAAQMVIGVQKLPFKAHAWVEVDGRVVNDKPYVHDLYAAMERC
jgi:hypothetical protein